VPELPRLEIRLSIGPVLVATGATGRGRREPEHWPRARRHHRGPAPSIAVIGSDRDGGRATLGWKRLNGRPWVTGGNRCGDRPSCLPARSRSTPASGIGPGKRGPARAFRAPGSRHHHGGGGRDCSRSMRPALRGRIPDPARARLPAKIAYYGRGEPNWGYGAPDRLSPRSARPHGSASRTSPRRCSTTKAMVADRAGSRIVLVAENLGHIKAIGAMTGRSFDPYLGRAFLGDGIATMLSGSGGGTGVTTYAENMGRDGRSRASTRQRCSSWRRFIRDPARLLAEVSGALIQTISGPGARRALDCWCSGLIAATAGPHLGSRIGVDFLEGRRKPHHPSRSRSLLGAGQLSSSASRALPARRHRATATFRMHHPLSPARRARGGGVIRRVGHAAACPPQTCRNKPWASRKMRCPTLRLLRRDLVDLGQILCGGAPNRRPSRFGVDLLGLVAPAMMLATVLARGRATRRPAPASSARRAFPRRLRAFRTVAQLGVGHELVAEEPVRGASRVPENRHPRACIWPLSRPRGERIVGQQA